jgi:hypothetical protein
VFAESAADVARAVKFARAQGIQIAPQGTGHGSPSLEPLEDAMLLRTDRMRRVEIDPATRTARAEAGAQWQDVTGPAGDTRLASIEIRHLGGALACPVPGGGAQPEIDANYVVFTGGFTPTPEAGDTVRAQAQAVKDALAAWHASYDYYNFAETPAGAGAVLPPASYRRLEKIKATYAPDQAIISAHPVWPARR